MYSCLLEMIVYYWVFVCLFLRAAIQQDCHTETYSLLFWRFSSLTATEFVKRHLLVQPVTSKLSKWQHFVLVYDKYNPFISLCLCFLCISDTKYVEYFEKAYASIDDATFGQSWTMGDIKIASEEFDVRSTIECGILCTQKSTCAAWQFAIRNETITCLQLSSYQLRLQPYDDETGIFWESWVKLLLLMPWPLESPSFQQPWCLWSNHPIIFRFQHDVD